MFEVTFTFLCKNEEFFTFAFKHFHFEIIKMFQNDLEVFTGEHFSFPALCFYFGTQNDPFCPFTHP